MNKRKGLPYKVLTMATLTTMLFTTPGFAEEAPSVEQIVKQGQRIFLDEQREAAEGAADELGYQELAKDGLTKPYQPNEKVRIIVEVEQPTAVTKTVASKKGQMKQVQDEVIAKIGKTKAAVKVKHRFYEGFNGFSMETEFRNIKDIKVAPGVKQVHIARVFQPSMGASKELVQAQQVWERHGYGGEGLLVAVIDSGIDYTHQDMTLTSAGKDKQKWRQENIDRKLAETDIQDTWFSDKVPTGYDWADNDADVIPRGTSSNPHGMHVAGTVGANGDEVNDGVKGIAPGVQLLAEKVFSDKGGGAYEDDIIAGIEHAVTMGADVINMSLGTDAGFVGEAYDPTQKVIREATERGALVVVAGGNSAYSTKNNIMPASAQPYAENPDISTVGEPGVGPYALSVASYENTKMHMNTLQEENGLQLPYQDQTQYNFKLSSALSLGESYEMVYVGEGRTADFVGKDVAGKVVVAKPNQLYATYAYVQNEAKKKGAKAVIIVPPAGTADFSYLFFSPYFLPAVTTSKAAGDALIAKLTSGQIVKMKLSKGTWIQNPDKDTMSDFSSIGAPHTLDFKPEISAPGGNIYSTVPGNQYEIMSGTSMATPHVAGGAALLLQALYEKGLPHGKDAALKAKIALMNTAKVVQDPRTHHAVPYSPRVQGSGLMQIQNAIQTPVLVTNSDAPLEKAGAVALKEITSVNNKFRLDVEALENLDVKDVEYEVYVDLLTDEKEIKEFDLDNDGELDSKQYLTTKSQRIKGAYVFVNEQKVTDTQGATFKIKPGQKKKLDVAFLLPANLKKGTFVEGYVRLVPTGKNSDKAVPLTVPYMGYYGKWDEPKNIDPAAWEKDAFLGYTALWNDEGARFPMGYDPNSGTFNMERIVLSPNAVVQGAFSTFTSLRNLQKTEMYVENDKGELVQYLGDFSEYTGQPWKFRKNIMVYRNYMNQGYLWNMKDQNGQFVKDGNYQYVIKTTLDYPGAKPQEVKMPIKIDSVAPVVSDIRVQPKDGQYEISFTAKDNENGSGYNGAVIWYNGKYKSLQEGQTSTLVKEEPKSVVVMGVDYALNQSYTIWGDPSYTTADMFVSYFSVSPSQNINASKPARVNGFANNRVDWAVNVRDASGNVVDSMTIQNEHEIHLEWKPEADLPSGTYTISADVTNKQGFKVTTQSKTVTVLQP